MQKPKTIIAKLSKLGMTQTEIGNAVGVKQPSICEYAKETRKPSQEVYDKLVKLLKDKEAEK